MTSASRQRTLGSLVVNGLLFFLVLIWTIPTLGLLVSSFRTRNDIQTSGWWTIFPHQDYETTEVLSVEELGLDPSGEMEIRGVTGTFEEFRAGVTAPDGSRITWVGNRRLGRVEIQEQVTTTNTDFTLENYSQVLSGKDFVYTDENGNEQVIPGDDFTGAFLNSLAVAIPATVIPILIAAYGFAWMNFPGRRFLFILVVALLVVPLQIALVPILRDYAALDLNGTFLAVWLAHTGFGLPLATYLLFNYISLLPRETLESAFMDGASHFVIFWRLIISLLPRETLESAFMDGASHFVIFWRLIIPLSVPALASFAIFQFLWVWNDYLVALIFLGGNPEFEVVTQRLANIVGSRGNDWHLLTAGAFITMLLPLVVFFSLQRFFVRGLLAGSVKG